MTATPDTLEQLRERIAELEMQNKALTERLELIRKKCFPLPDISQLGRSQYEAVTSELVGNSTFTDLGRDGLWPAWCRLPDGNYSESVRRRHHDNMRRLLGK